MRQTLLIIALLVHVGCVSSDDVRIDTGSEARFEASLNAMQHTLSQSEQQKLMMALLQVRMMGIGSAGEAQESIGDGKVLAADQLGAIDGFTYEEILALAEQSGTEVEVIGTRGSATD